MPELAGLYPAVLPARNRWTLAQRGPKNNVRADVPYAFFHERERGAAGQLEDVATILLTNRECAFKCVMCDLWQHTLDVRVPVGSIRQQIDYALERLPPATTIKLYNAGSFFDPNAIPPEEYRSIAERVQSFERVIVECHPAYVGSRVVEFKNLLRPKFEVAIGLETANPIALEKINKRITVADFRKSAEFLRASEIDLRVFLLLNAPFIAAAETLAWTKRSIEEAAAVRASVVVIIPTRMNAPLRALHSEGLATCSSINNLEHATEFGIGLGSARVFADLWDLEQFSSCEACFGKRRERLQHMNNTQFVPAPIHCESCAPGM